MSVHREAGPDYDEEEDEDALHDACIAIVAKRKFTWDDLDPSVQDAITAQARAQLKAEAEQANADFAIDAYEYARDF